MYDYRFITLERQPQYKQRDRFSFVMPVEIDYSSWIFLDAILRAPSIWTSTIFFQISLYHFRKML